MAPDQPLIELSAIVKDYHALRPLRVEEFRLNPREHVAMLGVDAPAAETLVNLITGAVLPDRGRVLLFGRDSASVADSAEWLALADRFGIVSLRAVLLQELTVAQNLAMPFSLDIEPLGAALRARAIEAGREAGLEDAVWDQRVSEIGAASRLRLRLARALALNPDVVLLEHPTVELGTHERAAAAGVVRAVLDRRGVAGLALTADKEFARAFASRVLSLNGASGRLSVERQGWFSRRV